MMTPHSTLSADKTPLFTRAFWYAAAGFFVLTLLMFGDVLFASKDIVLSNVGTDGFGQFLSWRKFGFDQLRQGHFPLWNPYVFCGAPYFGGFQAALLYPLNALFLFLPVTTAINYSIALHVFLAGVFVYLWTSHRKLHPLACFLAGVVWMFSGPFFLHIFAGHLPNLSTMIWAPLVFLTIDGILTRPSRGWCLFGAFVLTMQILAGHPQYVFYTSFVGGLYFVFQLPQSPHWKKSLLYFVAIYFGAVALAAVQLLTGAEATGETIRSAGLSSGVAASLSFPPENFLTLIAPDFFGDIKNTPYWGRWNYWEMSLFCGAASFVLSIQAVFGSSSKERKILFLLLLLTCLLALGANTKLFNVFYYYVPGFNKFRSSCKFNFLAALFICVLAATGLDDLLRRPKQNRLLISAAAGLAIVLFIAGLSMHSSAGDSSGWWAGFVKGIRATDQTLLEGKYYNDAAYVTQFGERAAKRLLIASGLAAFLAISFVLIGRSTRFAFLVVGLGMAEMFSFARGSLDHFDLVQALEEPAKAFAKMSGDGRCNFTIARNLPMYFNRADIWGNDPGIPFRYARLMAFTQKVEAEFASEFDVVKVHPFYRAFRCQYLVSQVGEKINVSERTNTLPHLQLLKNYRVLHEPKAILTTLDNRAFEPGNEVILETDPIPTPDPHGNGGQAKLIAATTDFLDIEADLPSASILLITDSYTTGWKARALPGSSQEKYDLLPADYCLRAVPLGAGHHRFRVEYQPRAFFFGKWISIVSLIAYVGLVGWHLFNRKRQRAGSRL